jgi:hypothetical protein
MNRKQVIVTFRQMFSVASRDRASSSSAQGEGVNTGQSFFLALLAAVAAWHELVPLTFR